MNPILEKKCKLLVDNKNAIENEYKWQGAVTNVMTANIFSAADILCDPEKMRAADAVIKENTGILSEFRGFAKNYLSAILAESDNPEKTFGKIKDAYDEIKKDKLFGTPYLIVAVALICTLYDGAGKNEIIKRTRDIFRGMKERHAFLTGEEDVLYAVVLAISRIDTDVLINEMEECFKRLKAVSLSNNALQSLSHILAMGEEEAYIKCARVSEIIGRLKEHGRKYGKGCELSAIGGLALLDEDVDALVLEIIEADEYLKDKRGFGTFGIGEIQRLMYAALMVFLTHTPKLKNKQDSSGVNETLVMQQTAIMCAVIVASTASSN